LHCRQGRAQHVLLPPVAPHAIPHECEPGQALWNSRMRPLDHLILIPLSQGIGSASARWMTRVFTQVSGSTTPFGNGLCGFCTRQRDATAFLSFSIWCPLRASLIQ
jgi:hypothetical protein